MTMEGGGRLGIGPASGGRDIDRRDGASIVNSWNEWDPLEEVVVGIADSACFEPSEPACRPVVRNAPGRNFPSGPKAAETIAAANEQLDGLADVLRNRGIVVRRPRPIAFAQPVQ